MSQEIGRGTDPKRRWRLALAGFALSLIAGAGLIAASPQPAAAHTFGVSGGTGCFVGNRARLSSFSSDLAYADVTEALPNVTFVDEIDGRYSVSELALLGLVSQVSPLEACAQSLEGAETQVKFDDSDAVWRSYQADIVVSEVIAVAPGLRLVEGDVVSFVVVADAIVTEADTRAALMGQGPVVVLGRRDSLVRGRPELFSIISHGGFWFQAEPDGGIGSRSLPAESERILLRPAPPSTRFAKRALV